MNFHIIGRIKFRVNLLFAKVTLKEVSFDRQFSIAPHGRTGNVDIWKDKNNFVELVYEWMAADTSYKATIAAGIKNTMFGRIVLAQRSFTVKSKVSFDEVIVNDRGVFLRVIAKPAGALEGVVAPKGIGNAPIDNDLA